MTENLAQKLSRLLVYFGVSGTIGEIHYGPLITEIQYLLPHGFKFAQIKKFERDIGRELGISGVRISEIPNSTYIRFEIPCSNPQTVEFAPLLHSAEFTDNNYALPICLGVDMRGTPVIKDLSKMPHMLVAGTTGSGKSVGLNSFIISLISKKTPHELQLLLIDPKRIEFGIYNNQQYMLKPVITDMNLAGNSLYALVGEMNYRYSLFESKTVRNITEYNAKTVNKLPYIVCVIDEFADLVMFDKEVEKQVILLAQKSRAAGIHLIIATQRPSVDVISGILKANLPNRLSYKVASPADSQTILNTAGAEDLFGRGDSLFLEQNGTLTRILGAYIQNTDIENALYPYRLKDDKISDRPIAPRSTEPQKNTPKTKNKIWEWIRKIWNRIGRRNQTKIINVLLTHLLVILGLSNKKR